jgi:hypothetical protein
MKQWNALKRPEGLLPEARLEHHHLRPSTCKEDVDGGLLADVEVPFPCVVAMTGLPPPKKKKKTKKKGDFNSKETVSFVVLCSFFD